MSAPFEPIYTADIVWQAGQPFSIQFDDIYFSSLGGLAEAQHVFVDGNQLIPRWATLSDEHPAQFVIGETGFGSGLNFLLAWSLWDKHAPRSARLHYIASEKHPLIRDDLIKCMALWPDLEPQARCLVALYPVLTPGFHVLEFAEGRVTLTLMLGDCLASYQELLVCGEPSLEKQLRVDHMDAWFLDGFSPTKNPNMWSQELLTTIGMLSKPHTTLATFSAAGVVKQGLQKAGFKVTKKPGYGSKRDMVVAEFECLPPTHGKRCTPWHVSQPPTVKSKRALVLGAGLAGCYMAYALANRGWSVTLIDSESSVAKGASGNHRAILYPKLTAFNSPFNNLMLGAHLFAFRQYQRFLSKSSIGELSGILQLYQTEKESMSQLHLKQWLMKYPDLGLLVDRAMASSIAGIDVQSGGVLIPRSGWLDSAALCQFLADTPGVRWVGDTNVTSIRYEKEQWHANEFSAEIVVLANGYAATEFQQVEHIPLMPIRGQMTSMVSNEQSAHLKLPVCADVHILPAHHGYHELGATFQQGLIDRGCTVSDDEQNIAKLKTISVNTPWSGLVTGHWAGVRAATPDYLPLVGPVARVDSFREQYKAMARDKNRWIPETALYHQGLYLFTGFGSRGLTTIPLSAEWLASLINQEPSRLPRTMVQSISPQRFLRRELIQGGLAGG